MTIVLVIKWNMFLLQNTIGNGQEIRSDCVTAGEQEFTCSCGEIYRAVIPASGHTDENADGVCDVCEESLGENVGDSEASGFLAKILEFFNKIAEFFRKLFNMA